MTTATETTTGHCAWCGRPETDDRPLIGGLCAACDHVAGENCDHDADDEGGE